MSIFDSWNFNLEMRDLQEVALLWIEDQLQNPKIKYIFLEAPTGCHAKDTDILMHNGSIKKVQDVMVGDMVMGPDSTPRQVLNLHSGNEPMYKITPIRGDSFVVNENHILSLISTNYKCRKSNYQLTGKEIINITVKDYLKKSKWFKHIWRLYVPSNGVHFNNSPDLSIDPYLLGLILGDGAISQGACGIITADREIVEYLYQYAGDNNLKITIDKPTLTAPTYKFVKPVRSSKSNHLIEKLRSLGLQGTKSGTKFIPTEYKTASYNDRMLLLAGLLDTDGHLSSDGVSFSYCTKSVQLKDDIIFLCRSLGFTTSVYQRTIEGNVFYDVGLCGPSDKIPTKIARKQARNRLQKKRHFVTGFSVDSIGSGDFYGFEVDGDNLYVMGNFFITHNSGKSVIGMCMSNYIHSKPIDGVNVSILTPQKILQKQYESSFNDRALLTMYGKNNYRCREKHTNCEIGSSFGTKCPTCPYEQCKSRALTHDNVVMNYQLMLSLWEYSEQFSNHKFKLIINDECHKLETFLTEFDTIVITENKCKEYGFIYQNCADEEQALAYFEKLLPMMRKWIVDFEDHSASLLQAKELDKHEAEYVTRYKLLVEDYARIQFFVQSKTMDFTYCVVTIPHGFKVKYTFAAHNFIDLCDPHASKFLFMSSTILGFEDTCMELGIDPSEAAFLSLPSPFAPKNRPVYYEPVAKMNSENLLRSRVKIAEKIVDLLNTDLSEFNGIIHTANYQVANYLAKEISHLIPHEVYIHDDTNRDETITRYLSEQHIRRVLISPSLTEGLDLKHDLGRFAIFAKLPYPYMGDRWVKKRKDMSESWYVRQMLIGVIQGSGRVVRSEDDWGVTYILDSCWDDIMKRYHHLIPKWWLKALKCY